MKNTRCTDFCVPKNSSIKQLLKTMRVTIFLLFFCVFSTIAGTVNSQNARVSIHKTNVPLEEILNEIEHQTDYLFMYSNNIDVKERTSIRVSEKPVSEVLKKLLLLFHVDNYFYNLQLVLLVPIFLFRTYLFSLVHSCPFLVINDLIHHYLV